MTTFTSSLPQEVLDELNRVSTERNQPKNKILEESLKMYFEELEKQKWKSQLKALADDPEMIAIAEEGMGDYYKQLQQYD